MSFLIWIDGRAGGTIARCWFINVEATVAFDPFGINAFASFDYDIGLAPCPLPGPPDLIINSVLPQTLFFNLRYSDFSSKYFLWCSSFS